MNKLKEQFHKEFETNNPAHIRLIKDLMVADWWIEKMVEDRERIIKWCNEVCESNISILGTDKWNGDLEDLITKLKQ